MIKNFWLKKSFCEFCKVLTGMIKLPIGWFLPIPINGGITPTKVETTRTNNPRNPDMIMENFE